MLKILIADDHPVFRQGLRQILNEASDMVVTDEVSDGLKVLGRVRASYCDVVLLDISLPGRNGIDILNKSFKTKYEYLSEEERPLEIDESLLE